MYVSGRVKDFAARLKNWVTESKFTSIFILGSNANIFRERLEEPDLYYMKNSHSEIIIEMEQKEFNKDTQDKMMLTGMSKILLGEQFPV